MQININIQINNTFNWLIIDVFSNIFYFGFL